MGRKSKGQTEGAVTTDKDEATVVNGPHIGEADAAAAAYAANSDTTTQAEFDRQYEERMENEDKPKETKSERFVRLAQKRVTKALLVLSHVQNLTNTNTYSYTPEQAQKIVDALVRAVEKIADGFSGTKNGKVGFTL